MEVAARARLAVTANGHIPEQGLAQSDRRSSVFDICSEVERHRNCDGLQGRQSGHHVGGGSRRLRTDSAEVLAQAHRQHSEHRDGEKDRSEFTCWEFATCMTRATEGGSLVHVRPLWKI